MAYIHPGIPQNSELLDAMRRSSPYSELILYDCVIVEPCLEGERPSRPYGDAVVCPSYHMVPIAFAERFCNTEQKFKALRPSVKEIKQLSFIAHREKWSKIKKDADIRSLPWPLETVPTSVEDITISSLRIWVLVVLKNKRDWKLALKNELKNFSVVLKNLNRIVDKRKEERVSPMLEKMCRVIDNVLNELRLGKSSDVWAALGCPDIDDGYKPMIN